jgi:hypothetical protein
LFNYNARMRTLTLFAGLMLFSSAGGQDLQQRVVDLIELYNEHQALALPLPDVKALTELISGGNITLSDRIRSTGGEDDQIRVVGYRLYQRPRTVVWVSALYKQLNPDGYIIEHFTPGEAGSYRLYQYLPMPWPIKDRHWTISVDKALGMAQSTQDQIWEHHWKLTPNGKSRMHSLVAKGLIPRLDEKQFLKAVYLPRNQGGWTVFEVTEDVTLLASHVSTVLSGWIPDGFIAAYTRRRVDNMMSEIDRFAATIDRSYDAEHFLVFSGSGEPIYAEALRSEAR